LTSSPVNASIFVQQSTWSTDNFERGPNMTSTEMTALDEIHQLAKKTAALLRAAVAKLDDVGGLLEQLEDVSYLLDAASDAADAAAAASDDLATSAAHKGEA
jgi:ABC-type transporter Mla subunit MlaD